jgi:serine/threonine-protein kinase HipA
MKRREALIARRDKRKEYPLYESDFLVGVYDQHRMGALRFKISDDGNFLNDNKNFAAPPWASLRDLEYASLQLEDEDKDDAESLKWLNMLIAPGSSLGGARPKASIMDEKGHLWIAKFPSRNDLKDIGAWEMVVHKLAVEAGLNVSDAMVQVFSGKYHTFLIKRFDRAKNSKRIHFASAMTLLGYNDGADHTAGVSYLELAGFIQQYGANTETDLHELWRRIVFNICVSNTDDHLRNHGFLLTEKGWVLAPAYDMNPIETGTGLTLNISETDNSLNLEVAKEVAEYFRLKKDRADKIIEEVISAVQHWRSVAAKLGISKNQIQSMESAFNHF